MKEAPQPPDEAARLAALRRANLLDTGEELAFDDLALLASQICGTPIALVSLVDRDRQWFKSRIGLSVTETPREYAFCAHAILERGGFEVHDALSDQRFVDNPLVVGDPHVRFYAAEAIYSGEGYALGTLCVIDRVPRHLTPDQRRSLAALARHVTTLIRQREVTEDLREANARLARATELVTESEARFRSAFESTAVGMAILALDGRYLRVNPALCEMLGYSEREMETMSVLDVTHPDEAEQARQFLRELPTVPGKLLTFERRSVRKNGEVVWSMVSTCCARDAAGNPLHFISHIQDVTARKRAEAERERSQRTQERLAAALEETSDLVAIVDPQTRIQFINRAGRKLLGLCDRELPPTLDMASFRPPWALARLQREAVPALLATGRWAGEAAFLSPDRGEVHVLQVSMTHMDAEGKPEFYSIIAHDISERRAVERMKDEFVSTVSHELRTPLTSIRGAIGLLEGGVVGALPEQALEITRIARTNCERLVRLINDVLDLEKMGAGKLVLHKREIRPAELVEAALEGMHALAEAAGVSLVASIGVHAFVNVDVDRFVQVLTNLVANAIKFSPRGALVSIDVEARPTGAIRFTVVDRGPGIPAQALPGLFRPFHQVDVSDARRSGGTGLGLAISKGIVEEHGGTVGVESEVGVGSRFWLQIAPAAPSASDVRTSAGRREVLLVADGDRGAPSLAAAKANKRIHLTRLPLDQLDLGKLDHAGPSLIVADLGVRAAGVMEWVERVAAMPRGDSAPLVLLVGVVGDGFPAAFVRSRAGGSDAPTRAAGRGCEGKVVLVVEDDPLMRIVLRKQLESIPVKVIEAADGDAAVRLACRERPDLIVLDVSLPGADGFEVIGALRAAGLDIPVIVHTASDLTEADRARLALGATRYLSKSNTSEPGLLHDVRELLDLLPLDGDA